MKILIAVLIVFAFAQEKTLF